MARGVTAHLGSRRAGSSKGPQLAECTKALDAGCLSPRLPALRCPALPGRGPHTCLPACPPAERTVALLVFEDVKASPLADLMDVAQRQKTASELNAAILASQSQVGWVPWDGWVGALAAGCSLGHRTAKPGRLFKSTAPLNFLTASLNPGSACAYLCTDVLCCLLRVCACLALPRPALPQEAEPKLPNLLKLLIWAQKQLDEKALYPRVENLVSGELAEPAAAGAAGGGAGD